MKPVRARSNPAIRCPLDWRSSLSSRASPSQVLTLKMVTVTNYPFSRPSLRSPPGQSLLPSSTRLAPLSRLVCPSNLERTSTVAAASESQSSGSAAAPVLNTRRPACPGRVPHPSSKGSVAGPGRRLNAGAVDRTPAKPVRKSPLRSHDSKASTAECIFSSSCLQAQAPPPSFQPSILAALSPVRPGRSHPRQQPCSGGQESSGMRAHAGAPAGSVALCHRARRKAGGFP